jgi:drug/metabolite transporter (DMT)-like permease
MRRSWPYLLLIVAGVGWGLGFPTGKVALRELSWPHMIVLRLGVAALAALPYALGSREGRRALFGDPWAWFAGVFYGLGFLIQFSALAQLTVSLAALLVGLMPALIAAVSILWGERVTRRGWLGVGAASGGAAVIGLGAGAAGGSPVGVLLTLASLGVFLGYVWGVRRMRAAPDVLAGPAAVTVIMGLTAAAVEIPVWGVPPLHLGAPTWTALLIAGLGSTLVASGAWQIGSVRAPAASAAVFINLEPLVGAAIGVCAFGDRLTAPLIAGGALILGGSLLTVLSAPAARPVPPEPA